MEQMNAVYLVECERVTYRKGELYEEDREQRDKFTLGVFDTAMKGISYLRKFFEQEEVAPEKKNITIKEYGNGVFEASAHSYYSDDFLDASTHLEMKRVLVNNAFNPQDDIMDWYVG